MTRKTWNGCDAIVVALILSLAAVAGAAPPDGSDDQAAIQENLPATVVEARGRARILHETLHGTLQVMHRDFFDPSQRLSIPSRSLEDVFKELERSWQVKLHWLVVNAEAMNVDNKPRDEFEKDAAKALTAGKPEFETVEDNVYRFAGSIRLASQCQRCHVPRRTSTEDRFAGLVIRMPLRSAP
ncbi:MAG: DUF3365 domain-containing protein [Pirellulaceae bacterium]|nr:DUF3365 domain-containing protein [Pirellulaceae bacterium]